MNLKECIFYDSACYKKNQKISKVTGIVVHSTGANNKTLKRYVQPSTYDKGYNTIIKELGINKNNNHWNKSSASKAVHAFIGLTENGKIATYHVLPYDICCWGAGKGKKGSFNYNPTARIQFEICEDNLKDKTYFDAAFKEAIEYCAFLCKLLDLTSDDILSHKESHAKGYASNHGDCDKWLKKHGKNMNWFRAEVKKLLDNNTFDKEDELPYKVKVTADALNIRKGAGTNYAKTGVIKDKGIYTIVDEKKGKGATLWGKLKSGAGWISLDYAKKV
jgi:N-acetylmuramoyl-L-alanine amidase